MQIRAYPCSPEQNLVNTAATVRPPQNWRSDSLAFHAARIACLVSPLKLLCCKSSTISALLKKIRKSNDRTIGKSSSESRISSHVPHQHAHKETHLPFWKHFRNGLASLISNRVVKEVEGGQGAVENRTTEHWRIFVRISHILTLPTSITHKQRETLTILEARPQWP